MAIRANAGTVQLTLLNSGRETANPPVHFADINSNTDIAGPYTHIAFGILVKLTSTIPVDIINFNGTDGSYIRLGHHDGVWDARVRSLGINFGNNVQVPIKLNVWTAIVVTVDTAFVRIFYGEETTGAAGITLNDMGSQAYPMVYPFANIQVVASNVASICNFKYWSTIPSQAELQDQMGRWDANGAGTAPMWASTLRTPGDISNIANPYTSAHWDHGHGFSSISDITNLAFDGAEPTYISDHLPCPTWVYPVLPDPLVAVNPGVTPLVPTIYKGPQFYQFADKGSVPITTAFQSITYYGWPHKSDARPAQSDTFPLYRDQTGVEVSDTIQRFETTTGVTPPAAVNAQNFYDWVYGAQFLFQPVTPQQPTADAGFRYQYLYIKYIGRPTGIGIPHVPGTPPLPPTPPIDPIPPVEPPKPTDPPVIPPQPVPVAMSGLFAIKAGSTTDKYGTDIDLKIPNPTIRTAYIGE